QGNERAAFDFLKVGDLKGASIDASLAHCVLQLLHREEVACSLGRVESVGDDDFIGIVDRAQDLVRAHSALGLDRREAVVDLPPSVEVRYPGPDDGNRAHHDPSFPGGGVGRNRPQAKHATKATLPILLPYGLRPNPLRRARTRAVLGHTSGVCATGLGSGDIPEHSPRRTPPSQRSRAEVWAEVASPSSGMKTGSTAMPGPLPYKWGERSGAGVEPTERGAATPHRF